MILVTGTKRSGTSMWMQALSAAGIPVVGKAFPSVWRDSIGEANPRGFYECAFRNGVYHVTNPCPRTGRFVRPTDVRGHAVKVFVPGLVRSDFGYIERVIATMRNWREYGPSLARLTSFEDAWLEQQDTGAVERAQTHRGTDPPAVAWWFENYMLLRDITTRRYPVNMSTYDMVLRDPEAVFERVLRWVGAGNCNAAVEAIAPSLRSTTDVHGCPDGIEPHQAELMDTWYDRVDRGKPLPASLMGALNDVHDEMYARWRQPSAAKRAG